MRSERVSPSESLGHCRRLQILHSLVFLAGHRKIIPLGNGAGTILTCVGVVQPRLVLSHRTYNAVAPYCQRQRREIQIHGKQQYGTDEDEYGEGILLLFFFAIVLFPRIGWTPYRIPLANPRLSGVVKLSKFRMV